MKFHITDDGPKECKATVRDCPYGAAGGEHYETIQEAGRAYEDIASKQYGQFQTLGASSRIQNLRLNNTKAIKAARVTREVNETFKELNALRTEQRVRKTNSTLRAYLQKNARAINISSSQLEFV